MLIEELTGVSEARLRAGPSCTCRTTYLRAGRLGAVGLRQRIRPLVEMVSRVVLLLEAIPADPHVSRPGQIRVRHNRGSTQYAAGHNGGDAPLVVFVPHQTGSASQKETTPMTTRDEASEMRPLRYSINVTLDGCCDHRAIPPDEDMH